METKDCFSHQIREPSDTFGLWFDYSRINPATGPSPWRPPPRGPCWKSGSRRSGFPKGGGGQLPRLGSLEGVHAVMGDGEVCCTAVECRAEVMRRLELHWSLGWTTPHLIHGDCHYVLASGKILDEAVRTAAREVAGGLSRAQGLPWQETYMLVSLACDLRISQVVNPLKTVRMGIPLELVRHISP